jgi:Immunity protein 50
MEVNPTDVVKGHERLMEIFGRWPSFHDSEVISIRLERHGRDQWEGPVGYVSVHVFEGYREAEGSPEVKWRNHTIVTFRFAPVVDLSLSGLNQQNAIQDLTFESEPPENRDVTWVGPAYRVNFLPSFGVGISFVCRTVELHTVDRSCPEDSVYA